MSKGFLNLENVKHKQIQFGNLTIDTIEAPRLNRFGYIKNVVLSIHSLLKGMMITLSYLLRPSTVVTKQYPENRSTLKMFDRYRASLKLIYEDSGYHRCTGCGICDTACPNGSINIISRKNEVINKKEIDRFIWRMDTCTFCNACVVACPYDALEWSQNFESSVYDRRLLIYNLNHYAGPVAKELEKITGREDRQKHLEPRDIYSGPVPMNGVKLDGIYSLNKKDEQ